MKRTLLAAVALCAVLPISAADAAPKKKKGPQAATFKATVTGTQVTTWSYLRMNPDDPCDAPARGDGSQTIRFSAKTSKLIAFKGKKLFGGRMTITPILTGDATIEREGDYKVVYPPEECGGDFGGGGGPDDPQDCGTRSSKLSLTLAYEPQPPADLDGLVPLTRPKKSVGLTGEMDPWSSAFENCPWWIAGSDDGPGESEVMFSHTRFPMAKFFSKRRKMVISADRTYHHKAENFQGKTLITWNVRLTRVR